MPLIRYTRWLSSASQYFMCFFSVTNTDLLKYTSRTDRRNLIKVMLHYSRHQVTTSTVLTMYMQITLPLGTSTWSSIRLSPRTRGPQPGYRGRLTLLNSLRYKSRTGKSQRVYFLPVYSIQERRITERTSDTAMALCHSAHSLTARVACKSDDQAKVETSPSTLPAAHLPSRVAIPPPPHAGSPSLSQVPTRTYTHKHTHAQPPSVTLSPP